MYAFPDGSGLISYEQKKNRELCKVAAQIATEAVDGSLGSCVKAAALRLKYLTFFDKP